MLLNNIGITCKLNKISN